MRTTQPTPISTIVVATDFFPAADLAVEQAAYIAKDRGAQVRMIHVFNDSVWTSVKHVYDFDGWFGRDPFLHARNSFSQQVRDVARHHGVNVTGETRTGRAAIEISRFVNECQADLLVVGKHGENSVAGHIIGGTAIKVLRRASVPLSFARMPVSQAEILQKFLPH